MERNGFERWHGRIERGLVRLLERSSSEAQSQRLREVRDTNRTLPGQNATLSRMFNSLGELSLKAGFQVLSIILLGRARDMDKRDPAPVINLSRARLSLANRFLLRAPSSGAVAHNLNQGGRDLDGIISRGKLPEVKLVEATLLKRRIEDRLELWSDFRIGKIAPTEIRSILVEEDREMRPTLAVKLSGLAELEALEPRRTGFYYREYREEQEKKKRRR